jgi:hypothetical protein
MLSVTRKDKDNNTNQNTVEKDILIKKDSHNLRVSHDITDIVESFYGGNRISSEKNNNNTDIFTKKSSYPNNASIKTHYENHPINRYNELQKKMEQNIQKVPNNYSSDVQKGGKRTPSSYSSVKSVKSDKSDKYRSISEYDDKLSVEFDKYNSKFILRDKYQKRLGSFKIKHIVQYIADKHDVDADIFNLDGDQYSEAKLLIDKYLFTFKESDGNLDISMYDYKESPLMGNIDTLIRLNNALYEYEGNHLSNDISELDEVSRNNVKMSVRQLIYNLINYSLGLISTVSDDLRGEKDKESLKNSLMKYSMGLVYRMTDLMKRQVNMYTTDNKEVCNMIDKCNTVRESLGEKLIDTREMLDKHKSTLETVLKEIRETGIGLDSESSYNEITITPTESSYCTTCDGPMSWEDYETQEGGGTITPSISSTESTFNIDQYYYSDSIESNNSRDASDSRDISDSRDSRDVGNSHRSNSRNRSDSRDISNDHKYSSESSDRSYTNKLPYADSESEPSSYNHYGGGKSKYETTSTNLPNLSDIRLDSYSDYGTTGGLTKILHSDLNTNEHQFNGQQNGYYNTNMDDIFNVSQIQSTDSDSKTSPMTFDQRRSAMNLDKVFE